MSIRRSHRNGNQGASNKARIARVREKALRMRERIKQATTAMMVRRERHLAWWQQAYRLPLVATRWIFSQASALWVAFMQLLGLPLRRPSKLKDELQPRKHAIKKRRHDVTPGKATIRTIMHEPLEDRVLFAFDSITIVGGATGSADSFLSDGEILQSEGSGDATVSINAIDTALKNGFNIKLEASQIDFASSIGSVSLSATGRSLAFYTSGNSLSNNGEFLSRPVSTYCNWANVRFTSAKDISVATLSASSF